MSTYLVSYDLHNQRHYQPVWTKLQQLGGQRLLESLWIVNSQLTATQLRDAVVAVADNDDSTAVVQVAVGSNWAVMRAKPEGIAMLRQYVTS